MHPASQEHDHEQCVSDAMAQAELVCTERSLRLTPLRRRVLRLVWNSHKPVGAYDVLEALSEEGKRAAPPTVYRALEFLMEAGLVHRLDSLNAFIGCPHPGRPHSGQFLICRECRGVTEVAAGAIEEGIDKIANDAGFLAERQMLEIQGLCALCRQ